MVKKSDSKKKLSLIKPTKPDDPIYKAGYVVGQKTKDHMPKTGFTDEDMEFFMADMDLGMMAQSIYSDPDPEVTEEDKRIELCKYAFEKDLAWALPRFLKRRGWIDEDWKKILDGFYDQTNSIFNWSISGYGFLRSCMRLDRAVRVSDVSVNGTGRIGCFLFDGKPADIQVSASD